MQIRSTTEKIVYDIETAKQIEAIETQFREICYKWNEWKALFSEPFEHLPIVVNTTPKFFLHYRECLTLDILISVSRLFDEETKYKRVSFYGIKNRLNEKVAGFTKQLRKLKTKLRPVREFRDNVGAHNSLAHSLKDKKVSDIPFADFDEIIKEVTQLLNLITAHLKSNPKSHFRNYYSETTNEGVRKLIKFLSLGLAAHRKNGLRLQ